MKNIIVFDNGGETFDRYTIINKKDGEMIGSSDSPFHPQGFGQYCGNVADNYWRTAYGYGWRNGCNKALLNKRIKYAVNLFLSDCGNIGKIIDFNSLPDDVKQFAKQSFEPILA
jgi:hypothetical protein